MQEPKLRVHWLRMRLKTAKKKKRGKKIKEILDDSFQAFPAAAPSHGVARRFEDLEPFNQAILEGEGGKVTPYCKPAVPFYTQYNGFFGFRGGVVIRYDENNMVRDFSYHTSSF